MSGKRSSNSANSNTVGRRVSKRTALALALCLAAVGGVALASQSVLASLNAKANNTTPQSVSTATLKLIMAPSTQSGLTAGFSTVLSSLALGDTINRFIDLSNTGSMSAASMTIKAQDASATALSTDPVNGVQLTISECSQAFTALTGGCAGSLTTALTSTSLNSVTLTPAALTLSTLAAGTTLHLKVSLTLPPGSETTANGVLPTGTVQGLTATMTWTLAEVQRSATNTNA